MSSATKANAVLAGAIIFLLLSSFAVYFAFRRLQNSEQWVLHTLDVQHSIDRSLFLNSRSCRPSARRVHRFRQSSCLVAATRDRGRGSRCAFHNSAPYSRQCEPTGELSEAGPTYRKPPSPDGSGHGSEAVREIDS